MEGSEVKTRLVDNTDIPKWMALSQEYDCYVRELVTDLTEWYDGNETSIAFGDYMDSKINKQEAFMAVDATDGCLGIIAVSKSNNRITFFAVSHKADFQTAGNELLKYALKSIDNSKPISINQITSTSPHIQKHRDLYNDFGFIYSCDSVENGVPVNTFIKAPMKKFMEQRNNKPITIRKAITADASNMAKILCESWRAAYKDTITPDELARNTDLEKRTEMFEKMIPSGRGHFYIAWDGDVPCGLCSFGNSRDTDMPDYAEIIAIYALQDYWGKGVGKKLLKFALSEIKRLEYKKVMLWVFEQNARARRFYEKYGFIVDGTTKDSGFANAKEVRYRRELKT
jgi:RimJ/RimL family protein N-acetyltransferase